MLSWQEGIGFFCVRIELRSRQFLYLSVLIILTVFVLMIGFEFVVEDLIEPFIPDFIKENLSVKWEEIILATSFTGLALIIPFLVSLKISAGRKLAETRLRESEEWFRALFENLPLSIHIKDRQGHYLLANKAYLVRTGKSLDEIKGKTVFDFFPEDVANAFTALDSEVLDSRQTIIREVDLPTPSKGLRHILVTKFPIFGPDGAPEAVGSINFDTTDQKRAEEAVNKSEARLTEIFNIAPEAVITIDRDMNIQLFNQGAERIFGYGADEVLGQPLDMLIPERSRKVHQKHIDGFDNSGDVYRLMDQRTEIAGLRKDGTEFPASASVSKLEIGGEKIFTVMMHDITERKHAQVIMMDAKREAETANRAKSEFLAAMSHEFRTPLNAILGFADILSHQYFGPIDDKYKEYAEDIHASGEHLLTLVTEILDLSTIEAGKQSLVKEKLSTMEIVGECERIIEEKARSLGIDLITKVPRDLPPLFADRQAIKQILLNLLSNAVKFTPEGGKITVSVKASKKNTTLKVADTGKGIPSEKIPKLTDPFTRADSDPYLTEKGWGLGLTITKSLVELHDGTLDIQSKVGKGTTVTVTMPNAEA